VCRRARVNKNSAECGVLSAGCDGWRKFRSPKCFTSVAVRLQTLFGENLRRRSVMRDEMVGFRCGWICFERLFGGECCEGAKAVISHLLCRSQRQRLLEWAPPISQPNKNRRTFRHFEAGFGSGEDSQGPTRRNFAPTQSPFTCGVALTF
jgi:hypothetical protein